MLPSWNSKERLTAGAFRAQWLGVSIASVGLLLPGSGWMSWVGLAVVALGLAMRHRADFLRRTQEAPRILSQQQAAMIRRHLMSVSKCEIGVGFLGMDDEAKEYAVQLRSLLESSGFHAPKVEGFMVFQRQRGLVLTVYNSDMSNPVGVAIRDAFHAAGIEIRLETNPNQREPAVALAVHSKPAG